MGKPTANVSSCGVFEALPRDVWWTVFDQLTVREVVGLRPVCRKAMEVCDSFLPVVRHIREADGLKRLEVAQKLHGLVELHSHMPQWGQLQACVGTWPELAVLDLTSPPHVSVQQVDPVFPPFFHSLPKLHTLRLSQCRVDSVAALRLHSLSHLSLHACSVAALPEIAALPLQSLSLLLSSPGQLDWLVGLRGLSSLELCEGSMAPGTLAALPGLRHLSLCGTSVAEVPMASLECLETLKLHNVSDLRSFGPKPKTSRLQRIHISLCTQLLTLPPLAASAASLTHLCVRHCAAMETDELQSLGEGSALEALCFANVPAVKLGLVRGALARLRKLELLSVGVVATGLEWLGRLGSVEEVGFVRCRWLTNAHLDRLPQSVTSLDITDTPVNDLGGLAKLPALQRLVMNECSHVASVAALARATRLQVLEMEGVFLLTSLAPLANLPRLRALTVSRHVQARDLGPLVCVGPWAAQPDERKTGERAVVRIGEKAFALRCWRLSVQRRPEPEARSLLSRVWPLW